MVNQRWALYNKDDKVYEYQQNTNFEHCVNKLYARTNACNIGYFSNVKCVIKPSFSLALFNIIRDNNSVI